MDTKDTYVAPELRDEGSLVDLTAACVGDGSLDEAAKADDPFTFASPSFGDPAFCTP